MYTDSHFLMFQQQAIMLNQKSKILIYTDLLLQIDVTLMEIKCKADVDTPIGNICRCNVESALYVAVSRLLWGSMPTACPILFC